MMTWHGQLFHCVHRFWANLRKFAFYNRTVFELFFITIYALEQGFLVWITYNTKDTQALAFVISMFAIVVLTTFAIHKIIMESRISVQEAWIQDLSREKMEIEMRSKEIASRYKDVVKYVHQYDYREAEGLNVLQSFKPRKKRK